MGLFDLFRPKWKHSDVEVRTEAVRALDADDRALADVALRDPESTVRRLAIKKIVDPALLARIAEGDADEALRKAAADKVGTILIAEASADSDGAVDAVRQIVAQKALAEVAKSAAREAAWRAALGRIQDDKALADVARNARSVAAQKEALARVNEAGVLRSLALNDSHEAICLAAVAKLEDLSALDQIAQKSKQKSVRNAAKERLAKLAPDRQAPVGRQATQKKAMQRQLCARAEATLDFLQKHRNVAESVAEMESLRDTWAELGVQAGDDELRVRFGKAVEKFEELRAAADKPKVVAVAPVAVVAAPEPAEKHEVDAEAMAHEEAQRAEKQAERQKRDEEKAAKNAEETARRQAKEAEKKLRQAEKEADRAANKDVWEAVIARLETLAGSEDRAALESAIKEAADTTDGARDLPREVEAALRGRYDSARKALAIKVQELRELDRWKSWANVPRLEALVAKMEALAAAGVTDAKETSALLKGLQAEWKAAGPAPREKRDALWEKFKKAADEVYARVKGQFAQGDAERAANLQKKEELCTRVEALSESVDWKETAETIKLLQEEWKATGPVPKDHSDALWKRFRGACDKFFSRKKEHFGEVDAGRDENLKKQEELVAKVEALAGSTQWKETAELIKQYQADWKAIGPGPRDASETAWKKFRAACDQFFEARKAHFAVMDAERGENLKKKSLLCEKVEALADSDDESTIDTVKALQAEWKTVGPAPKDSADEVWNRFRAACDRVFDRRRKAEKAIDEPLPATVGTSEQPSGLSGFTNKLPLAGVAEQLAAGWTDLAADDTKTAAADDKAKK